MNGTVCVDASVAAKWVLAELDSDRALALLRDARLTGTRLVCPPHLTVEVTSAIYKRVRQGLLDEDEGREQLGRFSRISLDLVSPPELAARAFDLGLEHGWALPYDSCYLAVALLLDCELWTADRLLYRDAHVRYPQTRFLADYPLPQ